MKKQTGFFQMKRIAGHKSETCSMCGQKVNPEIYKKHLIKNLKKQGLPNLAKVMFK